MAVCRVDKGKDLLLIFKDQIIMLEVTLTTQKTS